MTSDSSEYSSLLNKDEQTIKPQTQSNKCRNYGIITLLLLILSVVVVYYTSNGKIISNGNILSSQNAITAEKSNKIIITHENVDLNKLTPKVKLSDNNEVSVKITQLNSHVLKANLYHEKENRLTMFEFNVDNQEIEISMYKGENLKVDGNVNLKQENRVEYFKTSKDLNVKGRFTFQYNEEIVLLTAERKKDKEFQQEGYNKMNTFIQSWNIPNDLILLSINVGSYGLTGKSSHAVRYLHSLCLHFYKLQENVKRPEYFTTIIEEVNNHFLNKDAKITKEWFRQDNSNQDIDDFSYGDTSSTCTVDEESECYISGICSTGVACETETKCGNKCFGECGLKCLCSRWICGDCECHCLCKIHDSWCSCSEEGFAGSCCNNFWNLFGACCA